MIILVAVGLVVVFVVILAFWLSKISKRKQDRELRQSLIELEESVNSAAYSFRQLDHTLADEAESKSTLLYVLNSLLRRLRRP
jgi:outer membrane lipoprotein-sorting protein